MHSARGSRRLFTSRFLVVACLAMVLLFGAATTAEAGVINVWSGIQPSGNVDANVPVTIQGRGAADAYPLVPASAKLYIDGFLIPRAAYTATITATTAYFYYSPSPKLPDGTRTFRVEVSDSAGRLSSRQWTAKVVQPPTAVWVAPLSGSTVKTGRPSVTLSLADNSPAATFAVAGEAHAGSASGPVVATFSGTGLPAGQSTFALSAELPPGACYLTASVTDAAGNTLTLAGSSALAFRAAAPPAMTVFEGDCDTCHPVYASAHPTRSTVACTLCHPGKDGDHMQGTTSCDDCHTSGWHNNGAGATVTVTSPCASCHTLDRPEVVQHTAASVDAGHASYCEDCHNESLIARHAVTRAGSAYPNQCDMCHQSADARVQAAIAAKDARCSACHDRVEAHGDLEAIHQSTVTKGYVQALSTHMGGSPHGEVMACGDCHSTTNLLNLHGSSWNNCSLCHAGGGPRSTFAVWEKGCQQGTCHPTLHDNAVSDANHKPYADWGSPYCGYCHAGQGSAINYNAPLECTLSCHTAKVPAVGDSLGPVTSVANPAAYFKNPAQIQLTAIDAGSSVTGTYYRIDGGPWVFNLGATTTASVPAGGAGLLEYYSVDWFGNAEEIRSYAITFDLLAPVTLDNSASQPDGYPARLTVSDVGSGVASTWFSVDGSPFRLYGYFENIDGIRTDGGGGNHQLSYYSVDKVGNVETTVTVNWLIVDATPPTSTLSTTAGRAAYIEAVDEYSDDPCGIKEIRYRLDGGAWVVASFPRERPFFTMPRRADIVVPGDGSYQLEYYAVDWADNAEAPRTTTLAIDNVAPSLIVNAADEYFGVPAIPAVATDSGSGVASITYQIDSYNPTTVLGGSATITLYPPLTGSRTWTVSAWATDRAGNVSAVFGPKTIVVYPAPDYTKPTTYMRQYAVPRTLVTEGSRFSSDTPTMTFRFNAQDNTSGIRSINYMVDGGAWESRAGHPQLTYLDVLVDLGWGTHTVSFYAIDGAGNTEDTRTLTFTVEPAPLTLSFDMSNVLYNGTITWNSANYLYDVTVYRGGTPIATYAGQTWGADNLPLAYKYMTFAGAGAGPYTVEMVLHTKYRGDQTFLWYDVNGIANEWLYLGDSYMDIVPGEPLEAIPPVTYPSESSGDTIESDSGIVEIQLMATDGVGTGVASTHFRLNGGTWESVPGSVVSVDLVGYGTHTVEYYAVDNAGNIEVTQTLSLTIVAPPKVRFYMTNTGNMNPLVTDATWASAPYNYDVEVFSSDSMTIWDALGNTWDRDADGKLIVPTLSLSLALTGQRFEPFTAVVTVHMQDGTAQRFTSEPFVLAPGQSIDINGTFSDNLAWFDPIAPITTADVLDSYTGTAVITLTATDTGGSLLDETWYALDGAAPVLGTAPITAVQVLPPASGIETHTITYYSIDNFGNWETPHVATFTVAAP